LQQVKTLAFSEIPNDQKYTCFPAIIPFALKKRGARSGDQKYKKSAQRKNWNNNNTRADTNERRKNYRKRNNQKNSLEAARSSLRITNFVSSGSGSRRKIVAGAENQKQNQPERVPAI
jgi:hypothetical protein